LQIGGCHIQKGTNVTIDIFGVHHDARYWPEPEVFRPERFLPGAAEAQGRHPNAFLAFGLGAQNNLCPSVHQQIPYCY
jgi:cytochrome P450